jgi:hypothetical protein
MHLLDLICENGHSQRLYVRGMTAAMALDYARILDGSHDIYVVKPRDDPHSFARCKDCGGSFTATLFGFNDN